MIFGVGTDIVEVDRVHRACQRHGTRLAQRLLHEAELVDLAQQPSELARARFLAKRFAAKEAIAKAVRTGIRPPVVFRAMRIGHSALGAPELLPEPDLADWLQERGLRLHLSIADERSHVVAYALAEATDRSSGNPTLSDRPFPAA